MMQHLTSKQSQVLEVVDKYLRTKGYAPSLSEIQIELGIRTKRGAVQYLEALEKKGYLQRSGEARGLSLTNNESQDFIHIPILGYANAGKPLVYSDATLRGKLQVERNLIPASREAFAVIVKGDSMDQKIVEGQNLKDGSYAVIDPQAEVQEGDAALWIIDDCATIKSFHREGDMFILYPQSSNPIHRPIYVHEQGTIANGKVIAVLSNPI